MFYASSSGTESGDLSKYGQICWPFQLSTFTFSGTVTSRTSPSPLLTLSIRVLSQLSTTDLVNILAVKVGQNVVSSKERRKPLLTYFWVYKIY